MSKAKDFLNRVTGRASENATSGTLPDVPPTTERGLYAFLSAIKKWYGTATSQGLDGIATRRDLMEMGVVTRDQNGVFVSSTGRADYTPPTAPTNLLATGAMTNVLLEWDAPTYGNHAFTEIFGNSTNDLSTAVLVASTPGTLYSDPLGAGSTRYYWVRFVSTSDIRGPWNATVGVQGVTSNDPAWLLSVLTDELTESQLVTSLRARINYIDGADTGAGAIAPPGDLINGLVAGIRKLRSDHAVVVRDVDSAYEKLTQVWLHLQKHDDTFRTAGIEVNPTTGNVTIYAVDQLRSEMSSMRSDVGIRLDAINSSLTLTATKTYVDGQIAAAVISPDQLPAFTSLYARMDQAEIDINAAEASVATKASTTTVDGINTRLTTAEGTIVTQAGQIATKASQTALDTLSGRVTTAESTLSTIDGASIVQSARDVRYLLGETDKVSENALAGMLAAHKAGVVATQGVADARNELNAKVELLDTGLEATASAVTEVTAAVDNNLAYVNENFYTKADTDNAIATATNTVASQVGDLQALVETNYATAADVDNAVASASTVVSSASLRTLEQQAELDLANRMYTVKELASRDTTLAYVKEDINTRVQDGILAEATKREQLAATVSGVAAALQVEESVRTSEDFALAERITSLQTTLGETNAQIEEVSRTTASVEEALAEQINTLVAQVADTNAALQVEAETRATNDTAESTLRETLRSEVHDPVTGLSATRSTLLNDYYTKTGTNSAISSASTTLTSNYQSADASTLTSANSHADSAASAAQTAAQNYTASYAYAKTSVYTKAEADSAISSATTTLSTNISNVGVVSLQEGSWVKGSVVTGLEAQKTVKIDSNGYVTGYGLASSVVNGTPQSEFAIVADKFSIAPVATDNTADDGSPFFYRTTATTINGVSIPAGAYMKSAYIHDAAITTAKIKDLAVDNAKISSIDAAKINTGYLSADRINAGSITAAKIDSRGLSIKDANGNIILAAGSPLTSSNITPASGWLNSNISIASNGALSGGGGGQVTIGGLGYSGDLQANKTYVDASGNIQGVSSGGGTSVANIMASFAPANAWEFSSSADGWSGDGASLATNSDYVRVTASTSDPVFRSPIISVDGSRYDKIRARIRRISGSAWDGSCFYSTSGHGEDGNYYKRVTTDPTIGMSTSWVIVEWDMAALTSGGADWTSNTITRFRLDFGSSASDVFDVDWIVVGKVSPAQPWSGVTGTGKPADNATVGATFGVNIGGQITSSNASTYIANAAIQNAQIGNLDAAKITTGYLSADRINTNTINAGMIVSKSATSFDSTFVSCPDDTWVTTSFYMDHSGYVSILLNVTLNYSASAGHTVNVCLGQSTSAYTTIEYIYATGGTRCGATLTWSMTRSAGWHDIYIKASDTAATGAHAGFLTILKSYR